MRFTMWSWFHIIYLISPFIFFLILFLLTKNKSTKQKRPYWYCIINCRCSLTFFKKFRNLS